MSFSASLPLRRIIVCGVLFCSCMFASPASSAAQKELLVSAAASLTNAFQEVAAAFGRQHPDVAVQLNFAASNPLLQQLIAGAPVDVFATADQATMNKAGEAKVIDPATRKDFVRNTLVLCVPKGSAAPAGLDAVTKMKRLAVGNPDSVPAGRYARESLTSAGLWDVVQPLLIHGNSVRQVLDYVARSEVDAGIVYGTDAAQQRDKVDVALTLSGHQPVLYPIAVAATGKNPDAGAAFVNFVCSPEGQSILAKYGFAKP